MKRINSLIVCAILIFGISSVYAEVKNPDTFIRATNGTVRTLDPADAYGGIEGQRIANIYEPLIFFDGPYSDKYVPVLATEVPTVANGGISADGKTYTFHIRKGVKFHEGGDLTPEDVEYSIERTMVVDQDGGPSWMLLEALTGHGATLDAEGNVIPGVFEKIMNAVEVDGDNVILHLPRPYPPLLGILTGTWGCIQDKEWNIEHNCWDGTLENASKYNHPGQGQEPLQHIANGTGPYVMKLWEASQQFVFERNENYWGPKPALKTAIIKYVPEWSTRKMMLLNGDVDYATVETMYAPEMEKHEELQSYKVPQLRVTTAFFCQKLNPAGNPFIGSGKLDGKGISPDFFSDINVRKAFMHAFDRDTFQEDVLQNISSIPTNPNIPGLPYAVDVPIYEFDLEKAAEYMKKAWDGQVWEKGFKMSIIHNTGIVVRESAAIMLAENIMSLNPKFQIDVIAADSKDYQYREFVYPIFLGSWGADYPDPHNFMYTFMHSHGAYGQFLGYSNPEIDSLCDQGIATADPEKRAEIYEKLQYMWYSEAIGLCVAQDTRMRFYRDWLKGYIPNPMDSEPSEWLWRLSKE